MQPVLCLTVLAEAVPLGSGNPQQIHTEALEFEGCGTNSAHTNREGEGEFKLEVEVEELPLVNLLKTGLDEGSVTAVSGQTHVVCENIGGFIDIDCKYNITGLLFSVGAQHLTANKTSVNEVGEKALCPSSPTLDGLLKTLASSYILGEPGPKAALCKAHTVTCTEKDQVKSLHMVTTKPPVLHNTVANIECESSLGTATVLEAADPQKLDVTELSWKSMPYPGCGRQLHGHEQIPADSRPEKNGLKLRHGHDPRA